MPAARRAGLDFIRLATPTTDDARLPTVLKAAAVSSIMSAIAGITGTRIGATPTGARRSRASASATDLPVAVGFGVRTPAQAAAVPRVADAAVVGSALVERVAASLDAAGPARGAGHRAQAVLARCANCAHGVRRRAQERSTHELAHQIVRPKIRTAGRAARGAGQSVAQMPGLRADDVPSRARSQPKVCPHCGHHMRATAARRLALTVRRRQVHPHRTAEGAGSIRCKFRDRKRYPDRLKEARDKTQLTMP